MTDDPTSLTDDFLFAKRLAKWLQDRDHASIIAALASLRDEGFAVDEVIDTLLAAPAIRILKSSYELWEALLEKGREQPEELLLEQIPPEVIAQVRRALWGEDPHPPPRARLRIMHLK